jgi:GntR family transcriptional regulator
MVMLDEEQAALAAGAQGTSWLLIEGIRRNTGGQPICTVMVFVAGRYGAVADDVASLKGPIFARIEERWHVQVAKVSQQIIAARLPPAIAKVLGVRQGTVGMRFRRCYSDAAGNVILTSVNWHPAPRFIYETSLRRSDD